MFLKIAAAVVLLLAFFLKVESIKSTKSNKLTSIQKKWEDYVDDNDLDFKNKAREKKARNSFAKADKFIEKFNSNPNKAVVLGHTGLSHLTKEEYRKLNGLRHFNTTPLNVSNINKRGIYQTRDGLRINDIQLTVKANYYVKSPDYVPPESIDWVQKGFNTPVRSQSPCGNCWSFAVSAALEGSIFKNQNKLVSLSPQLLTDCDKNSNACDGGISEIASDYMFKNGISEDKYYPFVANTRDNVYDLSNCNGGKCPFKPRTCGYSGLGDTTKGDLYKVSEIYINYGKNDETLMELLDKYGPVDVGIDASDEKIFPFLKNGIYAHPKSQYRSAMCGQNTNHAVLLVGYGQETNGDKFWLIKNSWGTDWGMNGYGKISRDTPNNCGISSSGVVPIVDSNVIKNQSPLPDQPSAPAPPPTPAPEPAPVCNCSPAPCICCDGKIYADSGCKTAYRCSYSRSRSNCNGGMWDSASANPNCVESYSCNAPPFKGCQSEGYFFANNCATVVQCIQRKQVFTAPSDQLIEVTDPKTYRFRHYWTCPI